MSEEKKDSELEKLTTSMIDKRAKLESQADAITKILNKREDFLNEEEPAHAFRDVSQAAAEDYKFLSDRLYKRARSSSEDPKVKKQLKEQLEEMKYGESYLDYLNNFPYPHSQEPHFSHCESDLKGRKWTREKFESFLEVMIDIYDKHLKEEINFKDHGVRYRNAKNELKELLDESLQTSYKDRAPQQRRIVQEMTAKEWDKKKDDILGKIGQYKNEK